jgi:hypothetical protein
MKLKHLFSCLAAAAAFMFAGCADSDDWVHMDAAGMTELNVRGLLADDANTEYSSVVDAENATITVQVPYYISDTEEIQADLTQMKLVATLPIGATFNPSLAGIHDLSQGFVTTYTDGAGQKEKFTIKAEYVKSSDCLLTALTLTNFERATIGIVNPASEGENGTVNILKTSSTVETALHEAVAQVSPWATVECTGLDATTGVLDLSALPQITVVAQNGVDKTVYDVKLNYPNYVNAGEVGYISSLWGYQLYVGNEEGFESDYNRSMAVIGDYLVISNRNDINNMLVLDRFTGKNTGKKVNVTGMPTDCDYRAICSDDAGHLIAANYISNISGSETTNQNLRLYVWKNGIENAPTSTIWAAIGGSFFQNAPIGVNTAYQDLFHTVACKGDITGEAVLTTASRYAYRPVFIQFTDGKPASKAYVEWGGGTVSMWTATKIVPTTTNAPYGYIWSTGNFRKTVTYTPVGTGDRAINFDQPSSHWWKGNGTYDAKTRSIAYTEFNGLHLLAVDNEWVNSGAAYHRLYVANIGANPTTSSMADGFIFDSREGNSEGTSGISGTGYGVTGMTSSASYVGNSKTVLSPAIGEDSSEESDVVFGKSDDGSAVQVYMLVPGQGIFCFEITRFDM